MIESDTFQHPKPEFKFMMCLGCFKQIKTSLKQGAYNLKHHIRRWHWPLVAWLASKDLISEVKRSQVKSHVKEYTGTIIMGTHSKPEPARPAFKGSKVSLDALEDLLTSEFKNFTFDQDFTLRASAQKIKYKFCDHIAKFGGVFLSIGDFDTMGRTTKMKTLQMLYEQFTPISIVEKANFRQIQQGANFAFVPTDRHAYSRKFIPRLFELLKTKIRG
jgi:hypothetical protein